VDEEMRFHLDERVAELVRRGLTPDEARREASRRLGNLTLARERTRDADTLRWLDDLIRDVRQALRTFRQRPGFALTAILTLGLGIGLNTAIFVFGDALVWRPPDVPHPAELVRVFTRTKSTPLGAVSFPDYLDFRDRTTTLSGVAAYANVTVPVSTAQTDVGQVVGALVVSGNYFSMLGVEPAVGRGFGEADDRPGAVPVAVISHRFWERRFQSDPEAIGRAIFVSGRRFAVIGVMPPRQGTIDTLAIRPGVYLPIGSASGLVSVVPGHPREDRSTAWLTIVARLKPGISVSSASREMAGLARSLAQAYPDADRDRSTVVLPEIAAREALNPTRGQAVVVLLALAGLVLLIACANVANLLLSHATARTKEISIRLALGASRGRVIRQLLTESFLLTLGGALCGFALADAGVRYLVLLVQSILSSFDVAPSFDVRLGVRVLVFTLVASLAAMLFFGLMPAFRSTRLDLVSSLKGSRSNRRTRRPLTLRALLVASQVMVSVIVLAIAGFSIRQFVGLRSLNPGFRTDHVLLATFDPSAAGLDDAHARQFFDQMINRTRSLAGVDAVGLAQDVPLVSGYRFTALTVDGGDASKTQDALSIRSFVVDPGFWAVMRTPLVRGRPFTEQDTSTGRKVVLVNETMAARYWPDRDAIGGTIRFGGRDGAQAVVVGVVKDGKYGQITEPPQPAIFIPFSQASHASTAMTMMVRTAVDPVALAGPVRAAAHAIDPSLPAFNIRPLARLYEDVVIGQQRLVFQMLMFIGLLGTLLTVIGLYGVMAYLTGRRTHEIGVRMALGASRRRILLMVLKQAAGMVGAGLTVGLSLAYLLTPALVVAFNFAPHDVAVLAGVSLVLVTTAFAASWIPARRATRIDPTTALREE
jgi:predicted permease